MKPPQASLVPDDRSDLVVGACTALVDRPFFARFNLLQVASQTVHPHLHSIVASGPEFDCRIIEDLMDEVTLFTCLPESGTTLDCFTKSLRELYARGVNLFICLDHDCIYKRRYIESVCRFVEDSGLDVEEGAFCLNLIDQQWVTLYDDARADLEARSFRGGLGLSPEEAKRIVVGAPPTFVFGRRAAELAIAGAERSGAADGYHDIVWRRTLADAGIRITQVQTPEPVFAYVRHSANLCWGGQGVGTRKKPRVNGPVAVPPRFGLGQNGRALFASRKLIASAGRAGNGSVDISVVIPTYNEGEWFARTVESIRAAQTELRYEIVVADDGCTDGSLDAVSPGDDLRIVKTGGEQLGLIVAKNVGAKAARGRYLCFLDSHVLVHDYWLDYLRETCDGYPDGALVSGNLPDVAKRTDQIDRSHFGYIIRNCRLGTGWHFYGKNHTDQPYLTPLTPGGLMFTRKLHFARLGGFEPSLRKWGAEDIHISLRNYYMGGENIVDPRVVVYHYYKGGKNSQRSFTVSNADHWFNCLHVATVYFPYEYYLKVREAFATHRVGTGAIEEIESGDYQQGLENVRSEFVRGFEEWTSQFATELRRFIEDTEKASEPAAAAPGRQPRKVGELAMVGQAI